MKKTYLFVFATLFSISLIGQNDEAFTRNGKWVIETGTSLITGFFPASGGSILFDEGSTVTQIGIDIGKFVSDDVVVKVKAGIVDIEGSSLKSFSGGLKYYLGGKAPLEVNLGLLSGFGSSEFISEALIGYAATLADNVYFEPKGGIIYANEDVAGAIKFAFVMIL